jgi:integrase
VTGQAAMAGPPDLTTWAGAASPGRPRPARNVAALCAFPSGQDGRLSKSLTLAQAPALLAAAQWSPMHAYIVMSLMSGIRTEEVRALRWRDLDLLGDPTPLPRCHHQWLFCARFGNTATPPKSRRRLASPHRSPTRDNQTPTSSPGGPAMRGKVTDRRQHPAQAARMTSSSAL